MRSGSPAAGPAGRILACCGRIQTFCADGIGFRVGFNSVSTSGSGSVCTHRRPRLARIRCKQAGLCGLHDASLVGLPCGLLLSGLHAYCVIARLHLAPNSAYRREAFPLEATWLVPAYDSSEPDRSVQQPSYDLPSLSVKQNRKRISYRQEKHEEFLSKFPTGRKPVFAPRRSVVPAAASSSRDPDRVAGKVPVTVSSCPSARAQDEAWIALGYRAKAGFRHAAASHGRSRRVCAAPLSSFPASVGAGKTAPVAEPASAAT